MLYTHLQKEIKKEALKDCLNKHIKKGVEYLISPPTNIKDKTYCTIKDIINIEDGSTHTYHLAYDEYLDIFENSHNEVKNTTSEFCHTCDVLRDLRQKSYLCQMGWEHCSAKNKIYRIGAIIQSKNQSESIELWFTNAEVNYCPTCGAKVW